MRIEGFEHAPGEHCGSTSLRNLADYYGWGYDEPECFGLASGLGFTYIELPESPHRMFVGRPLWLEEAFFENVDVPYTHERGGDWVESWATVTDHIDEGDPVMVFVDLYYLDYYETDTHFAPHSLLVVGYEPAAEAPDGSTGVAYMADSEFDEVQTLPLSSLRAAWAATDVMPLDNRYLVADGDPRAPTEAAARRAVRETATYMLDPSEAERGGILFGEEGISGIRALAADLPDWHDLPDPSWTARFAYQNVERRGTGGGAFRGLYAPFLERLGGAAGLDERFAERMADIAAGWTAAGEVLSEASEAEGDRDEGRVHALFADAAARIGDLADREQQFYEDALAALRK